jgi:hypothetical protein
LWKGVAHGRPASFPAAECPSLCGASSRDTGRTGNRRGAKAGARRRRWSWLGCREPDRERLIFPHRSSRASGPNRWWRCRGPRNARQYPAHTSVARASIEERGKQGKRGNGRLARSRSRSVATNAGYVGGRRPALNAPLERELTIYIFKVRMFPTWSQAVIVNGSGQA